MSISQVICLDEFIVLCLIAYQYNSEIRKSKFMNKIKLTENDYDTVHDYNKKNVMINFNEMLSNISPALHHIDFSTGHYSYLLYRESI